MSVRFIPVQLVTYDELNAVLHDPNADSVLVIREPFDIDDARYDVEKARGIAGPFNGATLVSNGKA